MTRTVSAVAPRLPSRHRQRPPRPDSPIIRHDDAALNVGRPINNLTTYPRRHVAGRRPGRFGNYKWHGRTTPGLPNSTKLTHWGTAATLAVDVTDALTLKSISAYRNLKTNDYIDIDATQYEVGDVLRRRPPAPDQPGIPAGLYQRAAERRRRPLLSRRRQVKSHQEAYADDLLGRGILQQRLPAHDR